MTTSTSPLATTITGSLPRPHWFTENLRGRPFLTAMGGDLPYREQYSDAVATLIADQSRAGLDIVSDGEMRFDIDIGGRSWFGYLFDRMGGLEPSVGDRPREIGTAQARAARPGDILAEFVQTLRPPQIVGQDLCRPGVLGSVGRRSRIGNLGKFTVYSDQRLL